LAHAAGKPKSKASEILTKEKKTAGEAESSLPKK
jgi:hypothetical protein